MGATGSVIIPVSLDMAKAKELAGENWDQGVWDKAPKNEDGTISKDTWDESTKFLAKLKAGDTATSADPAAAAVAAGGDTAAASADGDQADGDSAVDRSGIERNANGCEEPSSADPELWNVDGCEIDYLVKYKIGGQMWYVQSRMRENPPKGQPIPGFPMNKKAKDAGRYHVGADEKEVHTENDKATHWNKEWQQPPVAAS